MNTICSLMFLVSFLFLNGPLAVAEANVSAGASQTRFVKMWGKLGKDPGEFNVAMGVALTADGTLLVSDFYNSRVERFTYDGDYISSFDTLPYPGPMALDGEGNIYVSHFPTAPGGLPVYPDRISVYSPQGKLLRQWGAHGKGDGQFDYLGGIAVDKKDRVYVADSTNHRIQVFDRQGKFLFKWGSYGTANGQFGGNTPEAQRNGGPNFLAFDSQGNLYSIESNMGRIQKFTPEGVFISAWTNFADAPGGFGGKFENTTMEGALGFCIDPTDHIWANSVASRVQEFTLSGTYLQGLGLGGMGDHEGQFRVPHTVVSDGRILFVADSYNHRIQKFEISHVGFLSNLRIEKK